MFLNALNFLLAEVIVKTPVNTGLSGQVQTTVKIKVKYDVMLNVFLDLLCPTC